VSNSGLRGKKSATNRRSYGTAKPSGNYRSVYHLI
jgi:hypothetical protein